jgi:hypothetical protein
MTADARRELRLRTLRDQLRAAKREYDVAIVQVILWNMTADSHRQQLRRLRRAVRREGGGR